MHCERGGGLAPVKAPAPSGVAVFAIAAAAVALAVGIGGDLRFRLAAGSPPQLGSAASQPVAIHPAAAPAAPATGFAPPADDAMPAGEYGAMVRFGQQVFTDTARYAEPYAGNDLNCSSCHLDAGRRAGAAPLWAAFVRYPAYRQKMHRIDTLTMRLQECFTFSMNGKAPTAEDKVLVALQSYAAWLATGARVGVPMSGAGYPALASPRATADARRGADVYAGRCASCHGSDGLGSRAGDRQVFPPLWGPRSFNAGAGMAQAGTAAAFIRANMPLGQGGTLSEQEAWDVATFVVGQARPPDPRLGSISSAVGVR